jgi:DNA mismatch endonuclease (patch repair protein)
MDKLTKARRSWNMSRIKSKDTLPELIVRKFLYAHGIRYRVNISEPGRPDIAIRKIHTAVFVNGCFWHGHENCRDATIPKSNTPFWVGKINANKERDARKRHELTTRGWDIITVWECQLGKQRQQTLTQVSVLLKSRLQSVNRDRKTTDKVR